MRESLLLFFITPLLLQAMTASADDVSVAASVDRKLVPIGSAIRLTVSINGTQSATQPELPDIQGFQARYVGPSTQVSFVNGQMSASVSHTFSLIALKVGKYAILPISVTYQGKRYQTKPINVEVLKGTTSPNRGDGDEALDLKDYIYLTLTAGKEKVYLNEGLLITIALYSERVDVRDIEYPTFTSTAFSVRDYEKPIQRQESVDGVLFNVVRFQTVVHPVSAGHSTLGPAELKCSLVVRDRNGRRRSLFDDDIFSDFLGRVKTRPIVLKSDPLAITVRDFPAQGKPRGFTGTVGNFDLHVEAKPTSVKVGEPITLTMLITGRGNIETISTPAISELDAFKTYDSQVTTVSGGKSFEQVLIPKDESVQAVPEIRFSYFDPAGEKYQTLRKGPIPILVTAMLAQEELKIVDLPQVTKTIKKEKLGRDILYIKDSIGSVHKGNSYLYGNGLFLFAQFLPLAACLGILIYQKRKDRLTSDVSYARSRQAPRKAKKAMEEASKLMHERTSAEFCDTVFRMIQEYLGDLFNLSAAGLTSEVLVELERRGIEAEILEKLGEFFELCDSVRFAPAAVSQQELHHLLKLTEDTMKRLSERSG